MAKAPILVWPKFTKAFILDVDWSTKGVSVIMSQWEGCNEKVVAYASYKSLSPVQKGFHLMEGQCYALIWGTMHFKQYLHQNHFTLKTNHKPLEWLAIVSNVYQRWGRWINMLQDFNFNIMHHLGSKHSNADAFDKNAIRHANENDDF